MDAVDVVLVVQGSFLENGGFGEAGFDGDGVVALP